MGVRFPSVFSTTLLTGVLGQNVETAIATTPPFTPPLDLGPIFIAFYVVLGTAAGTTGLTLRIRRGSGVAGATVNVATAISVAASSGLEQSGVYVDTPGAVSGQQYTLTALTAAAGAAGTINDVALLVYAL